MRLIDADKLFAKHEKRLSRLIDKGEDRFSDECNKERAVMLAVEYAPTAYDIDKVMEQLDSELYRGMESLEPVRISFNFGINKAIEIVKKGGKE